MPPPMGPPMSGPPADPMAGMAMQGPGAGMPMPPMGGEAMPPPMPMPPPPPAILHDVTVVKRTNYGCVKVVPVPPEEFGWGRSTRRIQDADYCYHEVMRSEHELIAEGYDKAQIKKLPSWTENESGEATTRDTVDESQSVADSLNRSARKVKIIEHYVRCDYEGDGVALFRVTTGADYVILSRDGQDDVIREDVIPFATMSPIIVTHRLCGRAIADLVKDIQKIKTAIIRGVLDNIYLGLNPRPEIAESHASDSTLDDLMVWRPGAPIRTKVPGGLIWQKVPDVAQSAFPVLEYLDATREWRTGVTRQGQGIDANALQNQSATAVNQMFTAAQARMKLIARIFAETGIRDMFALMHAKILKHENKQKKVRLRGTWVTVDPRQWRTRSDMSINVGLGTGDKSQEFAKVLKLIELQTAALQMGLAKPEHLFNTAKQVTKLLGLKSVDLYFADPAGNPEAGQQKSPEEKKAEADIKKTEMEMQIKQMELQGKAEIEKTQAQADVAVMQQKVQAEMALAEKRFELERELKMLDAQIKMQEHQASLQAKQAGAEMDERIAIHKARFDANARRAQLGEELDGEGEVAMSGPVMQALQAMWQRLDETHRLASARKIRTLVRDPKTGRASHAVETIEGT